MTMNDLATSRLRPVLRSQQWLGQAISWIREELHAAEVEAKDEQFLATFKGVHYRGYDLDDQTLHRR